MRSILRVGGAAGGVGGLAALALAPHMALAVALLVLAAGAAAGLGAAKWLERDWYGRQLPAGLRAGLLAVCLASLGALLGLVLLAPHDAATLAARSALAGLPLVPADGALAGVGWLAADLLAVGLTAMIGCLLAAILAQVVGLEKNMRFVRAVDRAREASRPLREEGAVAAALARRTTPPLATAGSGVRLAAAGASAAPNLRTGQVPALSAPAAPGANGVRRVTGAQRPVSRADAASRPHRVVNLPDQRAAAPLGPATAGQVPADPRADQPEGKRRRRSSVKPTAGRLTPEMIDALAAWARDTDENRAVGGPGGTPGAEEDREAVAARGRADSTYLNSRTPGKPRKRKKNATRDWIC